MPEETPELPVSPQEVQIQAPSFLEKVKLHKFKILAGILGVLVFIGAVFGAYKFGQKQVPLVVKPTPTPTPEVVITPTPEPTVAEVSQPSPSPVTIEKIPYHPIASWQIYTDSQAKFSVQYPETYKLGSSTPGTSVNFLSCIDDPQRGKICLSGYMVRVYEGYDGGSRRAWFEKLRPNFLIDPYFEDVLVVGIKSLIIMDGNLGGSTGSFVLIPKENKMYLLDFPFGWNPETKEKPNLDFIKQVLSTFRFLD